MSDAAATLVADRVRTLVPGAVIVTLAPDRVLRVDGQSIERDEAVVEVAWGSADLVDDGLMRPFYGLVRHSASLRWLATAAAGVDSPLYPELMGRGVIVTGAHDNNIPIAEFVMRAVLDHFQEPQRWRQRQELRVWERHDFREVLGTTWVVVGQGAIGEAVTVRAQAFGARVVGVRRSPQRGGPADVVVGAADLDAWLPAADVVVIAAPASDDTRGLFDARRLGLMRSGSLLVNVARGSIVDDDALLAALDRGAPESAVLDVFSTEPLPPEHPFWTHPQVAVTPHTSESGSGRYQRGAQLFLENLERFLASVPLRYQLGPEDM